MEHEYSSPALPELDVYYDLCTALVSVLERTTLITNDHEADFVAGDAPEARLLIVRYSPDPCSIKVEWQESPRPAEEWRLLVATPDMLEPFIDALQVYALLKQKEAFAGTRWIRNELELRRERRAREAR